MHCVNAKFPRDGLDDYFVIGGGVPVKTGPDSSKTADKGRVTRSISGRMGKCVRVDVSELRLGVVYALLCRCGQE